MNALTFTPGPWRRAGHRQIVTTRGAGLPICEVWSGGVGIEQADANEALIAAAPDMHAVLLAVEAASKSGIALVPYRVMAALRDVLAQASGRAEK